MMTQEIIATPEGAALASPLALIQGQPWHKLPEDLYIPPAALRVFLETFEGPLDLLLYLINKHNLDILDIPIAEITHQYVAYVELMKEVELELAADYLVMAAMLAEIKSRLLLPHTSSNDEIETDPRAELIRRLQEYERFKLAAQQLDELPRRERDIFPVCAQLPPLEQEKPVAAVNLADLLDALRAVLQRAALHSHHQIVQEPLSIRERMSQVMQRLQGGDFVEFNQLFTYTEGRIGVVVTFIAILELLKQMLIEIVQTAIFSPIHIKAKVT